MTGEGGELPTGHSMNDHKSPHKAVILTDFDFTQNSDLNTSLKRPSQELLNTCFSFEIGRSKHKL